MTELRKRPTFGTESSAEEMLRPNEEVGVEREEETGKQESYGFTESYAYGCI